MGSLEFLEFAAAALGAVSLTLCGATQEAREIRSTISEAAALLTEALPSGDPCRDKARRWWAYQLDYDDRGAFHRHFQWTVDPTAFGWVFGVTRIFDPSRKNPFAGNYTPFEEYYPPANSPKYIAPGDPGYVCPCFG